MRRRATVAFALGATLAAAGCGRPSPAPAPRNVVVIVVDTLRQDHVGGYGCDRSPTPNLDALAARAATFRNAYSVSSWTLPSVATLLTGNYPAQHGVIDFTRSLPEEATTLAELLRDHGFATAGVVANVLLTRRHGIDQGFERWDESAAKGATYVSTADVTATAKEFLDGLDADPRPFFLFVLYFDPHFQYRRHAQFGYSAPRAGRLDGSETLAELRRFFGTLTEEEVRMLVDRYDEEVRLTDAGIGDLLAHLEERGRDGDTIVVVASDHGEEFHGRGWVGHTRSLYEELVRVPLVVRDPRHPQRRVVDRAASLAGLTPTVLDLLGLDRSDLEFQGASFAAGIEGGTEEWPDDVFLEVDFEPQGRNPDNRPAFLKALIRDGWKIIRNDSTGARELYDLVEDPGELDDRAFARGDLLEPLARALAARIEEARRGALLAPDAALPPGRRQELEALGYAGT